MYQNARAQNKLTRLNYPILFVIFLLASIGFVMLYSAGGGTEPWMTRQVTRFSIGFIILIAVSLTSLDFWLRNAYIIYVLSFLLLILVEIMGYVGMGAQRWIDLYIIKIQPSEIMKISIIMALARYFHYTHLQQVRQAQALLLPLLMVVIPAFLIIRQPALGATVLIILSAASIIFVAGIRIWKVWAIIITVLLSLPAVWYLLHDYQKQRIMTFLDPESDPLGSGYHIIQSKIALGSGGFFGKGFMQGSQSHLDFLPEKQTDFIFSMLCEEFGFMAALLLLACYAILIGYCYLTGLHSRNSFGRFLSIGIATMIFLYVFINMAMVTGILPVVGEPLPLISYGGTSLLTFMFGLGLVFCADINREKLLGRAR